jgi:hypothetical protein
MEKDKKVLVQLRLSRDEARDLREAGEAQGRKLPAEIMQRLRASLTGGEPEIDQWIYGWRPEDIARNRALGQTVGHLASEMYRVAGKSDDQQHDRATVLAMVEVAMPVLLDCLGAKKENLKSYHRQLAHGYAQVFAARLAEAVAKPLDEFAKLSPPAVALARIAKALDVPIHEWEKSKPPSNE